MCVFGGQDKYQGLLAPSPAVPGSMSSVCLCVHVGPHFSLSMRAHKLALRGTASPGLPEVEIGIVQAQS